MRIVIFLAACAIAALGPLLRETQEARVDGAFPGWPRTFEGRTLHPLPVSARERSIHGEYGGAIARFQCGEEEVLLRWIPRFHLSVHSAAACLRASGYAITEPHVVEDGDGLSWGVFTATKDNEELEVRERIEDVEGAQFTDTSSWLWAALLGRSRGPWWMTTVSTRRP